MFESVVGRVVSAPPNLRISIWDGETILEASQLYLNDRLWGDYTREYNLNGDINTITINATSSNSACGAGYTNPHGTISGSGKYTATGIIINTDTLKVDDLVKVTPTESGQMWFVDYKIRTGNLGAKK